METTIKSFTELYAWQKAHQLTILIYQCTKNFPKDEIFGLTSQIRRSVSSIGANIAEGFTRRTSKDKVYFYTVACGSVSETLNHTLLARDLGYITKEKYEEIEELRIETHKLCNGLISSIKI